VRRGPKGVDEGGHGELTKGGRNGGAKTTRRRWQSDRAGVNTRSRREQKEGDGVLGCTHEGGREGKERGCGGDGVPFIGDAAGVGDADERAQHSNGRRV
jgi:hypothetical protein